VTAVKRRDSEAGALLFIFAPTENERTDEILFFGENPRRPGRD
jgi:hypothetical protein